MALVRGRSVLFRAWSLAKSVRSVAEVYISTDDETIRDHAIGFGAKVLLTQSECRNGSERVFAALQEIEASGGTLPEAVLNLQADAVLTPPWVIQAIVDTLIQDNQVEIATPATVLSWENYRSFAAAKANGNASGTLVVFDQKKDALYFSKGMIPCLRTVDSARYSSQSPVYRHIGLYGYRYAALKKYIQLEPTPLELTEGLEQLRLLENGIPVRIVLVDYRGRTHDSIDHPEDISRVEEIIQNEGELVE